MQKVDLLLPQLVGLNLEFVKTSIVPQIGDVNTEQLVSAILDRLKQSAELFADDNLDNQAQLKELWAGLTSQPEVTKSFEGLFLSAVNKVEDSNIKAGLTLITPEIVKTLTVVTDNQPTDGKQIEAIWKDFIKSDKFVAFLVSNANYVLSKFNLPTWLVNIIQKLLTLIP